MVACLSGAAVPLFTFVVRPPPSLPHAQGVEKAKDTVDDVGSKSKDALDKGKNAAADLEADAKDAAGSVGDSVESAKDTVEDETKGAAEASKDKVGSAAGAVKDVAGSAARGVKDVAGSTASGVKSAAGSAASGVKSVAGSAASGVKGAADSVAGGVVKVRACSCASCIVTCRIQKGPCIYAREVDRMLLSNELQVFFYRVCAAQLKDGLNGHVAADSLRGGTACLVYCPPHLASHTSPCLLPPPPPWFLIILSPSCVHVSHPRQGADKVKGALSSDDEE